MKTTTTRSLWILMALIAALTLGGCSDDEGGDSTDGGGDAADGSGDATDGGDTTDGGDVVVPQTYAFESRSTPGESGVSYSGQTARQVLISDLNSYIGALTTMIDSGDFMPDEDGEVVAALDFYFRFDSDANGAEPIRLSTEPAPLQATYAEISTDKDLVGKLAGNDTATDHVDWSQSFTGWSDAAIAAHGGGVDSPEALVVAFFETLEANAIDHANGVERLGADGEPLPVHVTASGLDLQQLTQKFLVMAINFHQATDDYLDDDLDGKGLLADNAAADGDAYTPLEHAWDEGFGYFGAARDYADHTDDEIATVGYRDSDGDGAIDLLTEYNFGASTNAAKRDRGSSDAAPTDFTAQAFEGFVTGRAIITAAGGPLDDDQMRALIAARDQAEQAWEAAIAATVVHYINDTLQVMNTFGADDYDFLEHAKVWGEMKGFALGFQFNPRSPLSDADFAAFHALVGDAPVLPDADAAAIVDYRAALIEARGLLGDAYGFDAANLGDDQGDNGW